MSPVTHQTIKLSKGKHSSAESGACVMELASMLGGEPFSDHPRSVCPVIGSFLRAYNDAIDERRRQDLYAYAAKVVGSRCAGEVERARAERLLEWTATVQNRRWTERVLLPSRLGSLSLQRRPPADALGTQAVRAVRKHTDETHTQALELVDQLLRIGACKLTPDEGTPRTESAPQSADCESELGRIASIGTQPTRRYTQNQV
jgi:hypothetical protein